MAAKVTIGEPREVGASQEHDPCDLDQIDSEQNGQGPKGEGPDDSVTQRTPSLRLRQVKHQNREHHGIVGTQQTFECHQERDCEEIGRLNIQERLKNRSTPP